jgi:hypothetical protein
MTTDALGTADDRVPDLRPDFPENGAQLLDKRRRLLDPHLDEATVTYDAKLSLQVEWSKTCWKGQL